MRTIASLNRKVRTRAAGTGKITNLKALKVPKVRRGR